MMDLRVSSEFEPFHSYCLTLLVASLLRTTPTLLRKAMYIMCASTTP